MMSANAKLFTLAERNELSSQDERGEGFYMGHPRCNIASASGQVSERESERASMRPPERDAGRNPLLGDGVAKFQSRRRRRRRRRRSLALPPRVPRA